MKTILIISTPMNNCSVITKLLNWSKFSTHTVGSYADASRVMSHSCISAVVINSCGMEHSELFQFCKGLFAEIGDRIPIILLYDSENQNRYDYRRCRAHQFIPSHYSKIEIVHYIRKVHDKFHDISHIPAIDNIKLINDAMEVVIDDQLVQLNSTEFKIFQMFYEFPERIITREDIISAVWVNGVDNNPRVVDVHINRLRNTLKAIEGTTANIETIRQKGYRMSIFT